MQSKDRFPLIVYEIIPTVEIPAPLAKTKRGRWPQVIQEAIRAGAHQSVRVPFESHEKILSMSTAIYIAAEREGVKVSVRVRQQAIYVEFVSFRLAPDAKKLTD